MSLNKLSQFFRLHAVLFSMLFALAGCLPAGETDVPDDTGDNGGEIESDQQIVGSVGDGPVISASIMVRAQDGTQLGTVSSGSTADFDIVVKTRGSNYPLRVDATGGTDLVTSATPDFTLRSSVLKPGKRVVANINPFTSFAMELASDLPGGRTDSNIESALATVSSELNSGLTTLLGTGAMTTEVDAGNIAELIRASETLGEAVRRTRDSLNSVGRTTTGDSVVAAIGSDLADGVIDGRGGFGADPRISAVFGLAFAQVNLEAMQNRLRVQGTDAMTRLESAMAQVFAGTPNPALADLRVTADMLASLQNGLLAAEWLQPTAAMATLRSEVAGLNAGMTAAAVRQALSGNAVSELDASLLDAANASATDLDLLNTVLRTGVIPSGNNAPVISGIPPVTAATGVSYVFRPTASDADNDTLTFSISGRPSWAQFNTATGQLQGVPGAADVGINTGISISVTDGQDTASLPAFTITVSSVGQNVPPTIAGVPSPAVVANTAYSFTPTAADADGDTLTFSISNRPAWASFNTQTGALTGTPGNNDVGSWNGIGISVTDGEATASLPAFSIVVQAATPSNNPPQISGSPLTTVEAGTPYAFQPVATDADGDTLTFSISNRPGWAQFNTATGLLSGTPGSSVNRDFTNIRISVSDGTDTASLPAFTISVTAPVVNTPPVISGTPSTEIVVGSLYDFVPTASDADGDTLTFSVTGLPAWASFDSTSGRLYGTPVGADVGVYSNVRISVSDGEDTASLAAFSITVADIVLGSATLTWTPPTQNTDGTPLTDLSGYRIYWGTSSGNYPNSVTINNPGLTSYVVENLAPGTYEFVSTALNASGVESGYSNTASKTIP
jgi:Putative Ig domain